MQIVLSKACFNKEIEQIASNTFHEENIAKTKSFGMLRKEQIDIKFSKLLLVGGKRHG